MPRSSSREPHGGLLRGKATTTAKDASLKVELPWKEISNDPRAPTGVQVARYFGIKNQGPRQPRDGPKSRDQTPVDFTRCQHATTSHMGNKWAYYNQCDQCKTHLEYFPRNAPGMQPVEEKIVEWQAAENVIKDELRKIQQE